MRIPSVLTCVLLTVLSMGCENESGELKEPIALDKVPADILKLAKSEVGDAEIYAAFTELEDGQPVYEFKSKNKTGKIREVEITKDGKILNKE